MTFQKGFNRIGKIKGKLLWILIASALVAGVLSKVFDHRSRTILFNQNINSVGISLNKDSINQWRSQLHVPYTRQKQECCGEEWKTTEITYRNTPFFNTSMALILDCLFALFLFLLLMRFVYHIKGSWDSEAKRPLRWSVFLLFLAFISDIAENIFILTLINNGSIFLFYFIKISTVLKLLSFFLVVILSLDRLSLFFTRFIKVLSENLLQVIVLLLLYGIFFLSDQGQNLLINLNSNNWAVLAFLLILSFFASLNWHVSKFFQNRATASNTVAKNFFNTFDWSDSDNIKHEQKDPNYLKYYITIPRMFGVMIFLIPASALIHVTMLGNPSSWVAQLTDAHTILFLSAAVFYYLFHKEILEKFFAKKNQKFLNLILLFFGIVLTVVASFNDNSVWSIKFLSLSLFVLAALFALITSIRNVKPRNSSKPYLFIFLNLSHGNVNFGIIILSIAFFLASVVFVIGNYFGPIIYGQSILPIVSIIFISYEIILTWLIILKWRHKINYPLIAIVFISLLFNIANNETYRLRKGTPIQSGTEVPDINQYIDNWIDSRKNEIQKSNANYQVYFVNGYGGGIRASAYFYMVINELDSHYYVNKKEHIFPHMFSMSTASGSSLGAASVITDLLHNNTNNKLKRKSEFDSFISQDFLSPVLIGLLAGDVFSQFSDHIPDRDLLQELTWEKQDSLFALNYFQIYANDKLRQLPALLYNISESQSGQSVLLSPFDFKENDMAGRLNANKLIGNRDLNLSTAALLTARFPIISPAARTQSNAYFHDGGITENSGIKSNLEMVRKFKKRILERIKKNNSDSVWLSKIKFNLISINNTTLSEENANEKLSQSSSLIKIIASTGLTGNSNRALSEAKTEATIENFGFFEIRVNNNCELITRPKPWNYIFGETLPVRTILPLGWHLSQMATKKLEHSAHNEVLKIIPEILKN